MEALIKNIQSSRNFADPTLFLGGLQMNSDQYFSPNDLHNQNYVPQAPAKIFKNYGATVEIDRRPMATLGLQVPRNAEQEALNEYFSKERVRRFASGQSGFLVSEQLSKQSELMANQFVAEEMDRRAGIRRAVLDATGLTPAQVQQQIATEALAGVNPRLIDVRDRQIQDAVNLYYNQNNIPIPVTTPSEPTTNIASTVPQEARAGLPLSDAEASALEDQAVLMNKEGEEDEEEESAPFGMGTTTSSSVTASDPRARSYAGSVINPYTMGGIVDPATVERVDQMSVSELAQFVEENYIVDNPVDRPEVSTINQRNNLLKSFSSIKALGASRLREVVLKWMSENMGRTNASSGSANLQKY